MQPEIYMKLMRKIMREHNSGDVWNWLCSARKHIATAIARAGRFEEDKVGQYIIDFKADYIEQSAAQRKKKETDSQGKGKGKGKGNVKGEHH